MDQVSAKPWLAHYDPGVPHEVEVPPIPGRVKIYV